jgi:hypothetical protein
VGGVWAKERGRKSWMEKMQNESVMIVVLSTRYGKLIKWRVVEGTDHIACMRKMRNEYKF